MGLAKAFRERYGIRSSVDELRGQADASDLKKTLGAWDVTALGVGAIVGAGVFTVTGLAASQYAGPAVVVSFVLAALVSCLAALAYAELSAMIPLGGSAYTYASASMGELLGWIVAWALILSYAVGNMAVAASFSDNVTGLLTSFGYAIPDSWSAWTAPPEAGGVFDVPAFLVTMLVTLILLRPVKESVTANLVLVFVKVTILAVFVAVAFLNVDTANWTPFAPNGFTGIMSGAALIFFAFIGFDAVSTAAEETKNPAKDLPRGILGGLAIVTGLFVLVALGLTGLAPTSILNTGEPLAAALEHIGLSGFSAVMNVGGLLATLSVLLVFQLATTRVFLTLARDGMLPESLAKVSEKYGTPNRITLALGFFVALGAAFVPLLFLVELTNVATLFVFAFVMLAVLALRKTEPDAPRPFRCPAVPVVPVLGFVTIGILMAFSGPKALWGFVAWTGAGVMIYAAYGVRHSRLRATLAARETPAATEEAAPPQVR